MTLAPVGVAAGEPQPADGSRAGSGTVLNGLQALRHRALSSLNGPALDPTVQHPIVLARGTVAAAEPEARTPPHVVQAYACLIGGSTAMAVAFAAGAENLVNTIAGGIVPTQNQGVLILGVAGIVFASFCAVGQALTPVYLYYTEPRPAERTVDAPRGLQSRPAAQVVPPTRVNFHSGVLGSRTFGADRRLDEPAAIGARPVANEVIRNSTARER